MSRTLTGFGVLIKLGRGCGIKAEVFKVYRKTKKMTDISQTQAGFLTHNPAVLVEIDDSFDFSDTPWAVFSKMPKRWVLLFHHLKMFLKRRKTVTAIRIFSHYRRSFFLFTVL